MGHKEIGSEFWNTEQTTGSEIKGQTYLLGRTAFVAVLIDMKKRGIKSVCLPEYCCESMIEPVLEQGFQYGFYPVVFEGDSLRIEPEKAIKYDAVLLVNYFGFLTKQIETFARICHEKGLIVLLDETHSIFTQTSEKYVDYCFGSYRKWTGIEAGIARCSTKRELPCWILTEKGKRYLHIRKQARAEKTLFVENQYVNEELRVRFLKLYSDAETIIETEYLSDTDEENKKKLYCLDKKLIQERRRQNAEVIYRYLRDISFCKSVFPELNETVIPLAVPIIVQNGERDEFRNYLQMQGIFCPVHWPVSSMHKVGESGKELYQSELSLVCDQRYDVNDMKHMMEIVRAWKVKL